MEDSLLKELVQQVSEILHRKCQELEEQIRETEAARATLEEETAGAREALVLDQDTARALIDLQQLNSEKEIKDQRQKVGTELDTQRQKATKEITSKKKDCEEELANQRLKATKYIAALRSNWETGRLKQETELFQRWRTLKKKEENFEAGCVKATHVLSLKQVILNLKVLFFFFNFSLLACLQSRLHSMLAGDSSKLPWKLYACGRSPCWPECSAANF